MQVLLVFLFCFVWLLFVCSWFCFFAFLFVCLFTFCSDCYLSLCSCPFGLTLLYKLNAWFPAAGVIQGRSEGSRSCDQAGGSRSLGVGSPQDKQLSEHSSVMLCWTMGQESPKQRIKDGNLWKQEPKLFLPAVRSNKIKVTKTRRRNGFLLVFEHFRVFLTLQNIPHSPCSFISSHQPFL